MRSPAFLLHFLQTTWSGWSLRHRIHAGVVLLAMVLAIALQQPLADWFIEDAAISFAYAKHAAMGEGLVTYPGGERVEGYSNPTWTFLLTLLALLGVNGFVAAKWMGAIFGAAVIPVVYAITRLARGARPDDDAPAVAALLMGVNAQAVIWNAAGLENPLFSLLLALGIWRILVEEQQWRWPLSAVFFMLLAMTRPEAILYGALAGFVALVSAMRRDRAKGARYIGLWLLAFFLPFGAYHALRYRYFAWPFPNTYYAKLGSKNVQLMSWSYRGWSYTREWAWELWHLFFLPIYALAMVGLERRRWLGWLAICALIAVVMYPGPDSWAAADFWPVVDPPRWWVKARIWGLLALLVAIPLTSLGRAGASARILCWGSAGITLFFAVYSSGDWMKGYRWFSLLTVPASVLFAIGAAELADLVRRAALSIERPRLTALSTVITLTTATLAIPPNIAHLDWFYVKRETGPFKVRKRVGYNTYLYRRMHLDRPTLYDVDMGANMYWGSWEIVDMAGLVDVPMGHHHFERPFLQEYLWEERTPDLAHVHGGWARTSRIPSYPQWKRDYIEAPGYPSSKKRFHIGNYVRKTHFMMPEWPRENGVAVPLEDGITLYGLHLVEPTTSPGGDLYVEVGVGSRAREADEHFRVLVFLSDERGVVASWAAAPAYDWIEPNEWRADEIFVGRFSFTLPSEVPEGTYDIGVVVFDSDGGVAGVLPSFPSPDEPVDDDAVDGVQEPTDALEGSADGAPSAPYELLDDAALGLPEGWTAALPRMATGELRQPGRVRVVSTEAHNQVLEDALSGAIALADAGECEEAEQAWQEARLPAYRRFAWLAEQKQLLGQAQARCLSAEAANTDDLDAKAALLSRARKWDHWSPEQQAAAATLVPVLEQAGDEAAAALDWDTAFRRYSQVMGVDATKAAVRKKAEHARDKRFGLDAESQATKEQERLDRIERARERQEQRKKEAIARPVKELDRLKRAADEQDDDARKDVEPAAPEPTP